MARLLVPSVVLGSLLASASALAACPRLAGEYWCMIGRDRLDALRIGQSFRKDRVHVYNEKIVQECPRKTSARPPRLRRR